jgi:hypothetical protein
MKNTYAFGLTSALVLSSVLMGCNPTPAVEVIPGKLTVTISGVPTGNDAKVTVTGVAPVTFTKLVPKTETLDKLVDGSYNVAAADVLVGADKYIAEVTPSTPIAVKAGTTATATVKYTKFVAPTIFGKINVTITGLPNGTDAAVLVTGPNNFKNTLKSTTLIPDVGIGAYNVSAPDVSVGADKYTAVVTPAALTVEDGKTASSAVVYSIKSTNLALVTFAGGTGVNSAQGAEAKSSAYSEKGTDATADAAVRNGDAVGFSYTLTKAASTYLGAGLAIGTAGDTLVDLSKYKSMRIKVSSSAAGTLRIRIGSSNQTIRDSGCYPVKYLSNVTSTLTSYTIPVTEFAPETFCPAGTPALSAVITGVNYFEVADNTIPSSGTTKGTILLSSIEFLE